MNQFKAIFLGGGPADDLLWLKLEVWVTYYFIIWNDRNRRHGLCTKPRAFYQGIFLRETLPGVEENLVGKMVLKFIRVYSKSLFYGYWEQTFERAEGFCSK